MIVAGQAPCVAWYGKANCPMTDALAANNSRLRDSLSALRTSDAATARCARELNTTAPRVHAACGATNESIAQVLGAIGEIDGGADVLESRVRAVANDVLRHRVALSFEANAEGVSADAVIGQVIEQVAVA